MIKITFPDGSVREYESGVTGLQIAESISSRLAQDVLACGVNGETIELNRPITADASIQLYKWDDPEAKHAFWHTSAHLMADAMQELVTRKEALVRSDISKADALQFFAEHGQTYKNELIEELEDGHITTYTQGQYTDLCRGPHLMLSLIHI